MWHRAKWARRSLSRAMLAVGVILTPLATRGADPHTGKAERQGNSASATLSISVVVIPIVHTSTANEVSHTRDNSISYRFSPLPIQHFDERYEMRNLPEEQAPRVRP